MKDIIRNRLNRISDLNERKVLKKIITDVYEEIIDYNMEMYKKLEKRIYDEIDDPLDKFYIYSSVMDISDVDPISDFFHPMIKDDLNELLNMKELGEKLRNDEKIPIAQVFLKCNYLIFKEILNKNKVYKGYIKTDKNIYDINIILKQSMKYIKEIENLYYIFQLNSTEWNTLNCPYVYKFVDIILNSSVNLKQEEEIKEIIVDLEDYEKYKLINKVPVWNIKKINIQDKTFPMPAEDKINNEHIISLSNTGNQNGYMLTLENREFKYLKRYDSDLVIISSLTEQNIWNLIQIENISNINNNIIDYDYETVSNKKNLGFIGKFASLKSLVIRTKGEIARLMTSYELKKDLSFYDIELVNTYSEIIQTMDYNDFIDDNIRVDDFKKILIVKFKTNNKEDFLIFDKMSFLVSEMQMLFPEYKCIGELI